MKNIKKMIKKKAKSCAIRLYQVMNRICPIQKDIIVFDGSMGRNYTGNCRYIYENMVERGLDRTYRCIWFFRNTQVSIPGEARVIRYGRLRYLYYMAVAGIWVFDCRQPAFLKKRPSVTYIQTWHGTPLKKLALDMEDVFMAGGRGIEAYKAGFYQNSRSWDYLISQNPFSTTTFRRCFAFEKEMLEIGYPRNDMLIHCNDEESIQRLKTQYGLPQDKRVILYAPTWRDDEYHQKGSYRFRPKLDFMLLKERLERDYVMIVKYHYLVQECIDWSAYGDFIYHIEDDITGMYLVSDYLITDYSSVMFDYSVLRRPMFFYCYDLDKYKNTLRGFYFDFQAEAPGPISETTEELLRDIETYDGEAWRERYQRFTDRYNPWDDGCASEKVVRLIESLSERSSV